jgi:hypothetical protein
MRNEYFGTKVRVISYTGGDCVMHKVDGTVEVLSGIDAALMRRNINAGLDVHVEAESAGFADYMDRLVGTYD